MSFEWTPATHAALRLGDDKIMDHVFNTYHPRLYLFCYRLLGNKEDAEDIAIITITKLWESRDKAENIQSLAPWLYTAARNKCLDLMHSEKRYRGHLSVYSLRTSRQQDPATENEHDMLRDMVAKKLVRSFGAKITGLTSQQRTVFLYHLDNLDLKEIAEIMNLDYNTVHDHLQLAKQKIHNALIKIGLLSLILVLWVLGKKI